MLSLEHAIAGTFRCLGCRLLIVDDIEEEASSSMAVRAVMEARARRRGG